MPYRRIQKEEGGLLDEVFAGVKSTCRIRSLAITEPLILTA
jgi:hypothetical protein